MFVPEKELQGVYKHIAMPKIVRVKQVTGVYAVISFDEYAGDVVIRKEDLLSNYNKIKSDSEKIQLH